MAASPEVLGYVAAAAPLVSVASPTLAGWLADNWAAAGAKTPYSRLYTFTMSLFVIGNALQSVSRTPYSLGFARILIGSSTGSVSVGLGYILRELSDPDERAAVVNVFSGVEMLGYILGTATGGILSATKGSFLGLRINAFTAPTIVPAVAAVLLMASGLSGFASRERKLLESRVKAHQKHKLNAGESQGQNGQGRTHRYLRARTNSESGGDKEEPHRRRRRRDGRVDTSSDCDSDGGSPPPSPPPPPPPPPPPLPSSGNGSLACEGDVPPPSAAPTSSPSPEMLSRPSVSPKSARSSSSSRGCSMDGSGRRSTLLTLGLLTGLYCVVAAMYNALETTSTPLTGRLFGWGVQENALLWTCSGVVGTTVSLGVGHLPPALLRPGCLLAAALSAAAVGPTLMLLSVSFFGSGARPLLARGASTLVGSALGKWAGGEEEAPVPRGHVWMFLGGFLLFDIGYVITESMLTILFAAAIEAHNAAPASGAASKRGTFAPPSLAPSSASHNPASTPERGTFYPKPARSAKESKEGNGHSRLLTGEGERGKKARESIPERQGGFLDPSPSSHHGARSIILSSHNDDTAAAAAAEGAGMAGAVPGGRASLGGEESPEEDAREAFFFGVFTSLGWFLGCALGAVIGNHLFLASPHALFKALTAAACTVAVALFAARHRVFPRSSAGGVEATQTRSGGGGETRPRGSVRFNSSAPAGVSPTQSSGKESCLSSHTSSEEDP